MIQPKRQKYRKQFRGKRRGVALRGNRVSFGEYGLKALESAWITSSQIEAARVVLSRRTRKNGKYWIRIFPDKPISQKPNEVGMGGGKGDIATYVAVVRPGRILFEVGGLNQEETYSALIQTSHKLPIAVSISKKLL